MSVDSPVELAGITEMGGASTQIAFVPRGDIMANKFPILLGGRRFPLYAHSYLDYGQDAVDHRIKEMLVAESSSGSQVVPHPCMLRGKRAHQVNLTVLLVYFTAAPRHVITLSICLSIGLSLCVCTALDSLLKLLLS